MQARAFARVASAAVLRATLRRAAVVLAAVVLLSGALQVPMARAQAKPAGVPAAKAAALQKSAAAQKTLADTRARIKAVADEQKRIEAERDSAAKALREADGKVAGTQRSLADLDADIATQSLALEDLRQRKLALENSLGRQRAELAALVRSAYALGKHQELKLLLEQDRIGELARVLAYHRYFQRSREARIGSIDAQLQELAQVQSQIEARQQALVAARAQRQGDLQQLAAQRSERSKLVASLDASYRNRGARLQALGRDEKGTVALLEKLRKLMAALPKPAPRPRPTRPGRPGRPGPSNATTAGSAVANPLIPTGPMSLPLSGSILAGYGGTMPDGHQSRGLLIGGAAGAPVHAVRNGRVAYSDWLKGYGLLLILDHGGGWMSLYAFNDTLLKSAGDEVRSGEAIATVGTSGGQGRPALYFELRRDGQPADPGTWLRR